MMRDYPQGLRSIVMDSPLPLNVSFDEESFENLKEFLFKVFEDCEKDTDCNKRFPKLGDRFMSFLKDLSAHPEFLLLQDPNSTKELQIAVEGGDVAAFIASLSHRSNGGDSQVHGKANAQKFRGPCSSSTQCF